MNVLDAAAGRVRYCRATPKRYEDISKRCARTIPNWLTLTAMRLRARWRFSTGTIRHSRFWIANSLLILVVLGALLKPGQAQTDERRDTCLNINKVTAEELEKVPGIGRARAEMIVRIRQKNGPFRQVEELRALPRLSEKTLKTIRKLVSVSRCESRPGGVTKPAELGYPMNQER